MLSRESQELLSHLLVLHLQRDRVQWLVEFLSAPDKESLLEETLAVAEIFLFAFLLLELILPVLSLHFNLVIK